MKEDAVRILIELVVAVVTFNCFFCWLTYVLQQLDTTMPARKSVIPGTKQLFLHWQDFAIVTWGDLLGLVWPQVAFFHLGYAGFMEWHDLFMYGFLPGLALTIGWLWTCLISSHKPDWNVPFPGKLSLAGEFHLAYFLVSASMGAFDFYHVFWTGKLSGPLMWLAIGGGLIWVAAWCTDFVQGKYEPVKTV